MSGAEQLTGGGATPPHVPPELVRNFNLYDFAGASTDLYSAWQEIQRTYPPLFYTPAFGGFWVLTRASQLEAAWPDAEGFSSTPGVGIPPTDASLPPMLPIDSDDPFHQGLRRPLNIALSPKGVAALAPRVRELAGELVRDLRTRGECEFVRDFSLKLPMEIFLRLVDLPSRDREQLISLAHIVTKTGDVDARTAATRELMAYLVTVIDQRTAEPGDDLLSKITQLEVEGRPLTQWEHIGYAAQVLFGGLDTVGSTMSMIAKHLAEHPEHQRALRDDPGLIPDAIEELIRRYSLPTVARRVTRDMDFEGVQLKAGDMVMLPTIAHGVDEMRWPEALSVKLDRCPRDHMGFGRGTHRCPGANLARSEIRIFLEAWLAEIPEFTIKAGAPVRYLTGAVAGLESLPLVWSTEVR